MSSVASPAGPLAPGIENARQTGQAGRGGLPRALFYVSSHAPPLLRYFE
jgi:hypothetical protein